MSFYLGLLVSIFRAIEEGSMFERQAVAKVRRQSTPAGAESMAPAYPSWAPTPVQATDSEGPHQPGVGFDIGNIGILPPESEVGPEGGKLPVDLTNRIQEKQGTGSALAPTVQENMENRFGHDFSTVRVHTDSEADALSRHLDAGAFTVGSDIFFSQQAANRDTHGGDALLTHELTHVVQQQGTPVDRGPLTVQATGGAREREADSVATAAASGVQRPIIGAVGAATGATIQRIPLTELPAIVGKFVPGAPPDVDAISGADRKDPNVHRTLSVEERVRVLEIKDAAKTLDREWEKKFDARLSSHKQALLRITGAMDQASTGFTEAQVAQAKTDQIKFQLIAGVAAVGFAFGFEWAFAGALGQFGMKADKIATVVEQWENPANAAVSAGGGNVGGAIVSGSGAKAPDLGSVGAGGNANLGGATALDFFTRNGELLEHHVQQMDEAFLARTQAMGKTADDDWLDFDIHAQDAQYAQLYSDLEQAGSGVEDLKDKSEIAKVIEYRMWILWLEGELEEPRALESAAQYQGDGQVPYDDEAVADELSVGIDIGRRMTVIGMAAAAGVGLREHWYERGSDDWDVKLMHWAENYPWHDRD